jgi:hypothetical protein
MCVRRLWTPVEGMRPFLLLCPDRKQFVVLLAREPDTKVQSQLLVRLADSPLEQQPGGPVLRNPGVFSHRLLTCLLLLTNPHIVTTCSLQAHNSSGGSLSVNAVLACARNYAALWLRHKNPFIDHTQEPSGDTAVLTFEVPFADVVGMDFRWPLTDEPRLVLEASCLCKRVFHSVRSSSRDSVSSRDAGAEGRSRVQQTSVASHSTLPQGSSCQQQRLLNCVIVWLVLMIWFVPACMHVCLLLLLNRWTRCARITRQSCASAACVHLAPCLVQQPQQQAQRMRHKSSRPTSSSSNSSSSSIRAVMRHPQLGS